MASSYLSYLEKYLNNLLNKNIYKINTELNAVTTDINKLQNNSIVNSNNIGDKVNNQNQHIEDSLRKKYNETSNVQNVHLKYEKLEIDRIKSHNSTLLIIYYILIIIFSFILFYKQRFSNLYRNIGIILLLVFYPLLIDSIEYFLYYIFSVIYSFFSSSKLIGNVYINDY